MCCLREKENHPTYPVFELVMGNSNFQLNEFSMLKLSSVAHGLRQGRFQKGGMCWCEAQHRPEEWRYRFRGGTGDSHSIGPREAWGSAGRSEHGRISTLPPGLLQLKLQTPTGMELAHPSGQPYKPPRPQMGLEANSVICRKEITSEMFLWQMWTWESLLCNIGFIHTETDILETWDLMESGPVPGSCRGGFSQISLPNSLCQGF